MDARLSHGLTLALLLWGVIAPLVGILVGHYLSRSGQREQWFRDKRYEDYQAVLSAIVAAYTAIVRVDMASLTSLIAPEMFQEVEVIKADSFRVLRDRIFIAKELNYGGILVEWDTIVTNYGMHASYKREFAGRFSELNDKSGTHGAQPSEALWTVQTLVNEPAIGEIYARKALRPECF
jgi:hypothetical protein